MCCVYMKMGQFPNPKWTEAESASKSFYVRLFLAPASLMRRRFTVISYQTNLSTLEFVKNYYQKAQIVIDDRWSLIAFSTHSLVLLAFTEKIDNVQLWSTISAFNLFYFLFSVLIYELYDNNSCIPPFGAPDSEHGEIDYFLRFSFV